MEISPAELIELMGAVQEAAERPFLEQQEQQSKQAFQGIKDSRLRQQFTHAENEQSCPKV